MFGGLVLLCGRRALAAPGGEEAPAAGAPPALDVASVSPPVVTNFRHIPEIRAVTLV